MISKSRDDSELEKTKTLEDKQEKKTLGKANPKFSWLVLRVRLHQARARKRYVFWPESV